MKAFFDASDVRIEEFEQLCSQAVSLSDYPHAAGIESNVIIYEGAALRALIEEEEAERALLSELNTCLRSGPGVLVIRSMYNDHSVIDASTKLFKDIVREEREQGFGLGDHFGNNERIWNSFQKVCIKEPKTFVAYYGNPLLGLVATAWLGPFYQITAQVNNVKPGSKAQSPHRDYHLGFQASDDVIRFPAPIQIMSQYLTLQGAIAHTNMPLESGPTLLLPFSQQYPPGYIAYVHPEFVDYFNANCVQLPLQKGDGLFFSPALFHGAGTNHSTSDRLANLLQVSSAFGRPMESIDTQCMINAVYPVILDMKQEKGIKDRFLNDILAAIADGYSFPTNLDTDPPKGGYAPIPEKQLVLRAIEDLWPPKKLRDALKDYAGRRRA